MATTPLGDMIRWANAHSDGRMTIFKFNGQYRILFDTPKMTEDGRATVDKLPYFLKLEDAVKHALNDKR